MAIADTINSIRTHLTADYESLENIGAELENVDKNIENIASVVNGIYDNLPKTTGEDTNLSLNTLKGKMNIIPKGDTKQDTYSGYNELNIYAVHPKGYTETVNGVTIKYNDNGSVTATGTATADISYFLGSRASLGDMFNGTYYLSGCTNGSLTTYFLQMWAESSGTYQQTTTEVTTNKVSGKNWNVTIQIKNGASVNYTFYPMMSKTSGKSFEPYVRKYC